ncbi:hypothetical protein [Pseudomonas sp. CGJS7]|uniref:hypothetical protein n=1 Tax=Pseudomonas sp. CGJS7 TaxID=3109348 RepID=UPI00300A0C74
MKWATAIVVLLVAAVGWWLLTSEAPDIGKPSPNESAAADSPRHARAVTASATAATTDDDAPSAASIPPPPVPAWQTMAEARVHGDDRAPPIERPGPESQAPGATAWELSDPTRYREYELRGQRRLREEYLMAAEQELPKWKALLARARATGAPAAAIQEAQEKIRRLEARQVALRNGD